mgnify:CR=1 FL=1
MIFQRVNRSDPERVFVVMLSNETCAADDAVQLELNSASVDGVKIRLPDTANEFAFVGVADAAITSGSYGLVQVYGYRSTSRVFQTNTTQATGLPLTPTAGQVYWQSYNTVITSTSDVTRIPVFACLMESIASSSASATISKKVFVRAL